MADESKITIEIDGQSLEARKGAMLIEVADANGIDIPRFCYHRKLSVAANCRMCLVEVEKAPKPLPACATPVMDGMVVRTDSPAARNAQKGTMEFLLINHPLDCPICDQGGECELQDVAMGYGGDVSRFAEGKRVVPNPDLGSLIATDMTRCIHCTRCVRFGQEIAGIRELGATGRGEHTTIGTYVEHCVVSELSGNVIDLCPVGALTSKPYRFTARPWELRQHPAVSAHDALGSNLYLHVRGNQVMRAVPRDNEALNEVWISDRDRFGYIGLNSEERLLGPRIKRDGAWVDCDWSEALRVAADGLRAAAAGDEENAASLGVLGSPSATVEELYLLQKLARGLGSDSIDHRLRQGDFSAQAFDPRHPWLGVAVSDVDSLDAALVIGANLRKEQPILAYRLRKAALKGATVSFMNPVAWEHPFPVADQITVAPGAMVEELAALAAAAGAVLPLRVHQPEPGEAHLDLARRLRRGEKSVVWLGAVAQAHPAYGMLQFLARAIATATGSALGFLPSGADAVGAALAGALPHRGPGAADVENPGLDARAMLEQPRRGYLLLGVEPTRDCWDPAAARAALAQADCVVALSAFADEGLLELADVLLPIAGFAETSGTSVNLVGDWQGWRGAVRPPGEARPAWKVLRVLGNALELDGFDHDATAAVLAELQATCDGLAPDNAATGDPEPGENAAADGELWRVGEVPMYAGDALVRRSKALQITPDAVRATVRLAPADAERLGLSGADSVVVVQGASRVTLPLVVDADVAPGAAWIPAGIAGSSDGPAIGPVRVEKD